MKTAKTNHLRNFAIEIYIIKFYNLSSIINCRKLKIEKFLQSPYNNKKGKDNIL